MRTITKAAAAGGAVVGGAAAGLLAASAVKFERERREAERIWSGSAPSRIARPGSVSRLSVTPLIDFYTADDTLCGEPGVSFLVRADDFTLLFDVGLNQKKESPSPLVRNMAALGVSRSEIDAVLISHCHMDHTGGLAAQKARTFELTPDDPEPLQVATYVPVEMTYGSAPVQVVSDAVELAQGVWSVGTIPRSLWLMGLTLEQAVAVNVEGRGLVLIIGCGHQTLERVIARAQALFDVPLYGVIGGLHFPVTGSRMPWGMQRVIGTGRLPWDQIRKDDVGQTVAFLQGKAPSLVGISAHDSCDWTIGAFRDAFGERYRDVEVGREIVV
jgi:7,8-dihydropterin-6-yl-methyl-4-(beta-D-ribofuranosyl)aminobenzene 5'-phosphate synthase